MAYDVVDFRGDGKGQLILKDPPKDGVPGSGQKVPHVGRLRTCAHSNFSQILRSSRWWSAAFEHEDEFAWTQQAWEEEVDENEGEEEKKERLKQKEAKRIADKDQHIANRGPATMRQKRNYWKGEEMTLNKNIHFVFELRPIRKVAGVWTLCGDWLPAGWMECKTAKNAQVGRAYIERTFSAGRVGRGELAVATS